MRRALVVVLLAAACGGGGGPDAAVVNLRCDDPTVVDPVRAAAQALPDGEYVTPAPQSRASLLTAIDQAAAAVSTGPPDLAAGVIETTIGAAIDTGIATAAAHADLHALTTAAARALTHPVLACPTQVTVSCVPAGGKEIVYGVAAADCQDQGAPPITCAPSSGMLVPPGESSGGCTATDSELNQTSCAFTIHAVPEGVPAITCPTDIAAACAFGGTTVMVPDPVVDETCGLANSVVNDAPGTFPVGETTITFTASAFAGSDSCTTTVTVSDTTPPAITCPASVTVARTEENGPADFPLPAATDNCDADPSVIRNPINLPHGTSTATISAVDDAGLVTECTTEVTVLDAWAVDGFRIAHATLGATTSVTLAWNRTFAPDATGYRVESAPDPAGPWSMLASPAVGTQSAVDAGVDAPTWYRVVTVAGAIDGGVTGPIRALPIAASPYDLRNQTVPGVTFPTTLYGLARHPADLSLGPFPLIVMLHGNHGICRNSPTNDSCATSDDHECPWGPTTPNAEGMVYLAETLATQGYVAVTISGNAMNCRNDYIQERGYLLQEHLRRWHTWATTGGAPFASTFVGRVDLTRVGLVGHSRGGEAVSIVPEQLAVAPITGVTISSIFAIAPTDYHGPSPIGAPYAVLLPTCDGDVSTLAGMHIYDRSLDPADAVARAQVTFSRANHNFFNTEWNNDDNGDGFICDVSDEVGELAQQGMLETTLGSWFGSTLGAAPFEEFVTADAQTPLGISAWAGAELDLRWSYSAATRTAIDSFEGPGTPATNLLGGANVFTGFVSSNRCVSTACSGDFEHDKAAIRLRWNSITPVATIGLNGLDVAGADALSFRVTQINDVLNSGSPQDFVIRVTDSFGSSVDLFLQDLTSLPFLYPSNYPREILQTVRIPIELLYVGPVDPSSVESLILGMGVLPGHETGAVLVTDFELHE